MPNMFANKIGTVLIQVGDTHPKTEFEIHKHLLVENSLYFEILVDVKTPQNQVIVLPNGYSAKAFESFAQWLYREVTYIITVNTSDEDCVHAYLLGKLLRSSKFTDLCNNTIRDRYPKEDVDAQLSILERNLDATQDSYIERVLLIGKFTAKLRTSLQPRNDFHDTIADLKAIAKEQPPTSTGHSSFGNTQWKANQPNNNLNDAKGPQWTFGRIGNCPNCKGGGILDVLSDTCATCGRKDDYLGSKTNPSKQGLFAPIPASGFVNAAPTNNFPQQPPTSLFNNTSSNSAGGPLFGRNTASQVPNSLFGNSPSTTNPSPQSSLFGTTTNSSGGRGLFGDAPTPAFSQSNSVRTYKDNFGSGNVFTTTNNFNQPSGGLFNNTPEPMWAQNNAFNSQPLREPKWNTNFSLAVPVPVPQTSFDPPTPWQELDSYGRSINRFDSISAHPCYHKFSPEELRLADYSAGRTVKVSNKVQQPAKFQSSCLFPSSGSSGLFPSLPTRPQQSLFPTMPTHPFSGTQRAQTTVSISKPTPDPRMTETLSDRYWQNVNLINPKDSQHQAVAIETMQAQLKALTETLTKFVINSDQRLQLVEKAVESAKEVDGGEERKKNENWVTKVRTGIEMDNKKFEKEREEVNSDLKQRIKIEEGSESTETGTSSPEIILTPSTSRTESVNSRVILCPDDSDSEDEIL